VGGISVKKPLPIGVDDFEKVRNSGYYYADKTLMIKEFALMQDEVALIARPRRFGKSLNMTMIREFFDITKNSKAMFEGLAIMDTEYAALINSKPVIYLSLKNCKGIDMGTLIYQIKQELDREYNRYEELLRGKLDREKYGTKRFYQMLDLLGQLELPARYMSTAIADLTRVVNEFYETSPILLIDEYDQPIISSYEHNYHDELGDFFAVFYGAALKGNKYLGQALLTGIQRVAKESIFSQLNNLQVYTVLHSKYAPYFGLTAKETREVLAAYDLELNEEVRKMYDGYHFADMEMYNPWSVLNYAGSAFLDYYWVNTSSNYLIKQALAKANQGFWDSFEKLAGGEEAEVWLDLDTSYVERESNYSLWGLLVNAGYLTVMKRVDAASAVVRIPNDEVMSEFHRRFMDLYQEAVIACTRGLRFCTL